MLKYDEQILVLRGLFKLFMANFEISDYVIMNKIALICKKIIDSLLVDKKLITLPADVCFDYYDVILDIVCFVYEENYMYEDAVEILKILTFSNEVDKKNKIRALEELLSTNIEIEVLIKEDRMIYQNMLSDLQNKKTNI